MSDFHFNTIPDETEEVWKDIPGFDGYQASDAGRVRSFWKRVGLGKGFGTKFVLDTRPQKIHTPIMRKGYLAVKVRMHSATPSPIHRLVLLAFVGPCPPGMQSCHNNGNPLDNRPSNLRWDTGSANQFDSIRHGTHQTLKQYGEANHQARFTEQQIIQIRSLAAQGISQNKIAKMFDLCQQTMSNILTRKRWSHLPKPLNKKSQVNS